MRTDYSQKENVVPTTSIFKMKMQQIMERIEEEHLRDTCAVDMIFKGDEYEEDEDIQMEDLEQPPPKFEDTRPQVHDPMEKVNLGTVEEPRITYISPLLPSDFKEGVIAILQEFKDCFAWNYDEMLGLDKSLVEHRLLIKSEFHPFQQPPRRMSNEVELTVKEEIEKLLKDKFIIPTRYVRWLSNIVPVMKKNGKLRVCVDFRDLNVLIPKDVYVMPIDDMLLDSTLNNDLLSFMDDFSGLMSLKLNYF